MQLTRALGLAFVRGALSATTIFDMLSSSRLAPFEHLPFYDQLEHLFVQTMAHAELETTPTTVLRLLEGQERPARLSYLVGPFGLLQVSLST